MSEWVQLFDTEAECVVYVNLSLAGSIYPIETGSEIWLLEHPGEPDMGRICVKESPDETFRMLREVPGPKRTYR